MTTVALQKNILDFLLECSAPIETKKDPGKWQKVQSNLDALKTFTPGSRTVPPRQQAQPSTRHRPGGQR